jgi:UDP-N-acetylmuramoylalanine--D-glutamate ligase
MNNLDLGASLFEGRFFFIKSKNCDILNKVRLNLLKTKKVLILGLGREGESSFKFLRKQFPKKTIGLADQLSFNELPSNIKKLIKKDKNIKLYLGKNYLKALKNYEIIIKTPGIPQKILEPYLSKNQIITTQTDIFLEQYAKQTIGITGTKGKSTTSTLIYKILQSGGVKAQLIGNIGKPPLSFFQDRQAKNFFVFELSSHQLRNLKISPRIAVFLNIFQEHLDYYKNFNEYFRAKRNITLWQKEGDYFVYNSDFSKLRDLAKKTKAIKIPFGKRINKNGCYIDGNWIYFRGKKIIKTKEIPLRGEHNVSNVMAAISVGMIFGILPEIIKKTIKEFKPLPHRLEFVGEFKGIKFFNDSLATVPEATINAVNSIKNIKTLILGGFDRGQNFSELAKEILSKDIKNLILFPDTGHRIFEEIKKQKKGASLQCFFVKNMKEAVEIAFQITKKGVCLLSPASASFGLFKDYRDRGNQFKKYVKLLAKK